jgi:hypothetical protein
MRLHVKKDELTQKLVAEYLEKGGTITVKTIKPRVLRISKQTRAIVKAYATQDQ